MSNPVQNIPGLISASQGAPKGSSVQGQQGSLGARTIVPISWSQASKTAGAFSIRGKEIAPENLAGVLEGRYQFKKGSLGKFLRWLGKGDAQQGLETLITYTKEGRVRIERVGFRKKNGNDKYYLSIDKTHISGGISSCQKEWASRRGTQRVTTILDRGQNHFETLSEGVKHAMDLSQCKDNTSGCKLHEGISRIKSVEADRRVAEAGDCDLYELLFGQSGHLRVDENNQPIIFKEERLKIYEGALKGLFWIHCNGYAHRDVKLENIVVIGNERGEIIGAKLIDWDFLTHLGAVSPSFCGTIPYFPPEAMEAALLQTDAPTTLTQADVWALMYAICEIEAEIAKLNPSESLLGEEFSEQFRKYRNTPKKNWSDLFEARRLFLQEGRKENLFSGLTQKTPMDRLIFSMAYIDPGKRISAEEAFHTLSCIASNPSITASPDPIHTLPQAVVAKPLQPARPEWWWLTPIPSAPY